MPALARMASAQEFFEIKRPKFNERGFKTKPMEHADYMDFCELYADYVCEHEKFIDRTGLAGVERIENQMHREGVRRVEDLSTYAEVMARQE